MTVIRIEKANPNPVVYPTAPSVDPTDELVTAVNGKVYRKLAGDTEWVEDKGQL